MEKTRITINNNGPVKIEGPFEVFDAQGNAYNLGEKKAIFLCRCGLSGNKPFCDGGHKDKFESVCQAV